MMLRLLLLLLQGLVVVMQRAGGGRQEGRVIRMSVQSAKMSSGQLLVCV